MKIAILGTRGIPNHYGGFEQITECLSEGLAGKGHQVTVYNSHNHPYKKSRWRNVKIIHCYDPEYRLKTAGQFIYDLNCIRDARRRNFDVIIFMGYTSSSVWRRFFPKKSIIISNMDGLEWKRTKYSKPVQWFLRYAEKLAVKYSHFHIADAVGIQSYLREKYHIQAEHIPYGASLERLDRPGVLAEYGVSARDYFLLMARMEPENNIDLILDGFQRSGSDKKFLVIGNTGNSYGRYLVKKYGADHRIVFTGALFDQNTVHTLRRHSRLYFHGHTVGGTNPSLLEAMASKALIAAHDNEFNRSILGKDAFYFSRPAEIKRLVENSELTNGRERIRENNLLKITEQYNWDHIVNRYNDFILTCCQGEKNEKPVYHRRYAFK